MKNKSLTWEGTHLNDKKHGISKLFCIKQRALFLSIVVMLESRDFNYHETGEYKNGERFGKETRYNYSPSKSVQAFQKYIDNGGDPENWVFAYGACSNLSIGSES